MEQVVKGFGGQEDFEKFEEVDFWREREREEKLEDLEEDDLEDMMNWKRW